jgi:phosphoribosylaminoimidazolecarboxamide formyltransferase/IMP cyclohydrolase
MLWYAMLCSAVVVDPSDYPALLDQLKSGAGGAEALQFRKRMAWKAFQHTASYDATVAEWMWSQVGEFWVRLCGPSFASLP